MRADWQDKLAYKLLQIKASKNGWLMRLNSGLLYAAIREETVYLIS